MDRTGFTLIELLIVLVIIAILAGALVPLFRTNRYEAQKARVLTDFEASRTGAHLMHLDTGIWPGWVDFPVPQSGVFWTGAAWALRNNPDMLPGWNGPYLDGIGVDPWGRVYYFGCCRPTTNTVYLFIFSIGQNQQWESNSCGADGLIVQGDDIVMQILRTNPTQ